MTDRIPVTVVAGAAGSGKSRLIAQLRERLPIGERWAILSNSVSTESTAHHVERQEVGKDERFSVVGGCACCVAGPVFRAALVRLLRAGPWQGLHIEVDPAGHPHLLVDQLRSPPFDRYLTVTQLLLTLDPSDLAKGWSRSPRAGPGEGEHLSWPDNLGWATAFLLRSDVGRVGDAPLAVHLASAPPWPRLERTGSLPSPPGWRVFSALPVGAVAQSFDLFRQWPAEASAQRRPFKSLLAVLAEDAGVTGFQALMRTPRAWYRWRFGSGRGPVALTFDEGRRIVETETAWRLDSRICLWLAPGADRDAIQARLQGLDLALEEGEEPAAQAPKTQAVPGESGWRSALRRSSRDQRHKVSPEA